MGGKMEGYVKMFELVREMVDLVTNALHITAESGQNILAA
jgi:hypothetical protein